MAIKTALVFATGSTAIGDACAAALRDDGFAVFQPDLSEFDPLAEVEWPALFAACRKAHGRLDAFVYCAPKLPAQPITTLSLAGFSTRLRQSAIAGWLAQKYAILTMREMGEGGAIVQVISSLGRRALAETAPQSAAEAGILMSSKAAALECAKAGDGIVVNTVLAGDVEPVEIANAVVFLVTTGSNYMTGAELPVDRAVT